MTTKIAPRVVLVRSAQAAALARRQVGPGVGGDAWTCLPTCGICSHLQKAIRKKQMLSLEHNKLPSVGLRRRFEVERGRTFSLGFAVARRPGGACDGQSGLSASAPVLIWLLGMEQPCAHVLPPACGCSPSSCLPLLHAV